MFLIRQLMSSRIPLFHHFGTSTTKCPRGAIINTNSKMRHFFSSTATNHAASIASTPNVSSSSRNDKHHNQNDSATFQQQSSIKTAGADHHHSTFHTGGIGGSRNSLDVEIMESIKNCNSDVTLEELRRLASQPCTPLSLSDMYKYASANAHSINYGPQRLRNAQFLYKELPIRVAQRAIDLLTLPHGLNKTVQVQEVTHKYLRYLRKLADFPCPTTEEQEIEFTDCLREIVQDRKTIPITIAQGVSSLLQEQQHHQELDSRRLQEMEKALYRFFNARIGLRLLAEHHILSCVKRQRENEEYRIKHECLGGGGHDDDDDDDNDEDEDGVNNGSRCSDNHEPHLGCIQDDCNPYIEARRVAKKVMKHCRECYGITPEIEVLDCTPERFADSKFTYVPHHLQYTLAELLKNSCRATITR